MKAIMFINFYIILLAIASFSCSAQKTSVTPSPPSEQEVLYFHRTNATKSALVFGHVNVIHSSTRIIPVSSAIIAVDNEVTLADESGSYSLTLLPGTHSIVVGQIGFYKSKINLKIAQGDSINLNFNLHYDSRPTND